MGEPSSALLSASARIHDFEYLYASNTNVSNFVSVKLSGNNNYHVWKSQMLCLLDSNNMGGIVDATFVDPRCSSTETLRQYDSLARGWILGSLSEDVLEDVYNLGSAKVVWEKLKSICDPAMVTQGDSAAKESEAKTKQQEINVISAETNTLDQGINPIQIVVGEDIDSTETQTKNEYTKNRAVESKHKKKLREAATKGDWPKVKSILKKNKGLATEAINSDGSTILHIAVGRGHNPLVKTLLSNYINDEQVLQKRDSDGSTALHIAAIFGNKNAAELLVKKKRDLLRIGNHKSEQPLYKAYQNMHLDTIEYLLKAVSDDGKTELQSSLADDKIVVDLLVSAISAKQYTLASRLVQKFPEFASKSDDVLMAIAKAFPSGGVSISIYVLLSIFFTGLIIFGIGLPFTIRLCFALFLICITVWKLVNVRAKQKEFKQAKKVLRLVCDEIDKLDYSGTHHPFYTRPVLKAACQNADKVVSEILLRSPEAIQSTDKSGYDIIQLTIIHRSEKIYKLIYDIGERKNLYRTFVDSSKNNILHLAGKLAPSSVLNQRTGAALQLQRELQWFEEVKKLVFPTYITQENIFKETPDMVFTREHKDLVKEGELWMKTTAESCSITAALITTIVFAASITVPGGSHQETGTPLFEKKWAFVVFAISIAISLFASTTALLVFLSILTARFAEKDFLVSLPRRLFIGLFSLLLSTTTMIVAFGATLFLVFCDEKEWMLAPICGLALIPIACFVGQQFPLLVDLFRSRNTHI